MTREGDILTILDGGTTWSIPNDTSTPAGRKFGAEIPGDIEIPPGGSTALARAAQSNAGSALFGSSAGLFSADVRKVSTAPSDPTPTATATSTPTATPSPRELWLPVVSR